jgi:hypothetical protein
MNPLIAAHQLPAQNIGHVIFLVLVVLFAFWLLSAIFKKLF